MKLLSTIYMISFITPCICLSMDFNKEKDFPLETIYNKVTSPKTATPKSPEEQFIAFENSIKQMHSEWNNSSIVGKFSDMFLEKKSLKAADYFMRAAKEAPGIIQTDEVFMLYAHKEGSIYKKNIISLINTEGRLHYENVTIDSLPNISDSTLPSSINELNNLPPIIKKYVMMWAYNSINATHECIDFSITGDKVMDIHATMNLAASVNHNAKVFKIWDLKTGDVHVLSKEANDGKISFSSDGSKIVTATRDISSKKRSINIDIWNSITKQWIRTVAYHNYWPERCVFINMPEDEKDILLIPTASNFTYCLMINQNDYTISHKECAMGLDSVRYNTFTDQGDYNFDKWGIRKKSIPFFLCSQAIKNTTNTKDLQNKIAATSWYKDLSEHEQKLIKNQIAQK